MLFCPLIFFRKFFQDYDRLLSEFQTIWILIRSDSLSGLLWVQTVCKSYQQTKLVGNLKTKQKTAVLRAIMAASNDRLFPNKQKKT